jgi:hypothetical protein
MAVLAALGPLALRAAPWLLAAGGIWYYGHSRHATGRDVERAKWEAAASAADKEILRLNIALVTAKFTALETYSEKMDAREPIILHDRETVRLFSQTPAGAVRCLDAGRVRDIEAGDAARGLVPAVPAEAGEDALHADGARQEP